MAGNPNIEDHAERLTFGATTELAYPGGQDEDGVAVWTPYKFSSASGSLEFAAGAVKYVEFKLTETKTLADVLADQGSEIGDIKAFIVNIRSIKGFTHLSVYVGPLSIPFPLAAGWPISYYKSTGSIDPATITFLPLTSEGSNAAHLSVTCILEDF
jgi:hypothetical protein